MGTLYMILGGLILSLLVGLIAGVAIILINYMVYAIAGRDRLNDWKIKRELRKK